jgi:hypothetical protein
MGEVPGGALQDLDRVNPEVLDHRAVELDSLLGSEGGNGLQRISHRRRHSIKLIVFP